MCVCVCGSGALKTNPFMCANAIMKKLMNDICQNKFTRRRIYVEFTLWLHECLKRDKNDTIKYIGCVDT